MRFLLDTHVLIWAVYDQEYLSGKARKILTTNEDDMLISAASAWEIATKHRLGKLPQAAELANNFIEYVTRAGYLLLPITAEHALRAGHLPGAHKDPFDRMIAAQALHEDLVVLSADSLLDHFAIRREW